MMSIPFKDAGEYGPANVTFRNNSAYSGGALTASRNVMFQVKLRHIQGLYNIMFRVAAGAGKRARGGRVGMAGEVGLGRCAGIV